MVIIFELAINFYHFYHQFFYKGIHILVLMWKLHNDLSTRNRTQNTEQLIPQPLIFGAVLLTKSLFQKELDLEQYALLVLFRNFEYTI